MSWEHEAQIDVIVGTAMNGGMSYDEARILAADILRSLAENGWTITQTQNVADQE